MNENSSFSDEQNIYKKKEDVTFKKEEELYSETNKDSLSDTVKMNRDQTFDDRIFDNIIAEENVSFMKRQKNDTANEIAQLAVSKEYLNNVNVKATTKKILKLGKSFSKEEQEKKAKEWNDKINEYDQKKINEIKMREAYNIIAEKLAKDEVQAKRVRETTVYRHGGLSEKDFEEAEKDKRTVTKKGKTEVKNIKKDGLTSVRKAIKGMEKYKNIYENFDKLKTEGGETALHHSRGTMLLNEGHNVLEFTVGGSSFYSGFRHEASGVKGRKDEIALTHKRSDKEVESMLEREYGKEKTTVSKDGKNVDLAAGVRYKERINTDANCKKTKISIPGVTDNMKNKGDFSIENTRKLIKDMGVEYLKPIFNSWRDQMERGGATLDSIKDTHIILQGHSRGAVAVTLGAMTIRGWINDEYPEFLNKVKFDIVAHEPVPGLGSDNGYQHEVDIKKKIGAETTDEVKKVQKSEYRMLPLENCSSTTVYYSLSSMEKVGFAFKPMVFNGADRIILTATGHESVLKSVDESQYKNKAKGEKEKVHNFAMTDTKTGEVYRSSGINELPGGVYFVDELGALVKLENAEEVKKLMKDINKKKAEMDRNERISGVVDKFFEDENKNKEREELGKNKDSLSTSEKLNNLVKMVEPLKTIKNRFNSDKGDKSSAFKLMEDKLDVLLGCEKMVSELADNEVAVEAYCSAYVQALYAATAYAKNNQGFKFTKSGASRRNDANEIVNTLKKGFLTLDNAFLARFVKAINDTTKTDKKDKNDSHIMDKKAAYELRSGIAQQISGNDSLNADSLDLYLGDRQADVGYKIFEEKKFDNYKSEIEELKKNMLGEFSNRSREEIYNHICEMVKPANIEKNYAELSKMVKYYALYKKRANKAVRHDRHTAYVDRGLDDLDLGMDALSDLLNYRRKMGGITDTGFVEYSIKGISMDWFKKKLKERESFFTNKKKAGA